MVKHLISIVLGAVGIFLIGAMIEEWEVFAQPWFTPPSEQTSSASEEDKGVAANTVHQYLSLSSHLYASGGDPRFAERIPASPAVVDEALREIDYLRSHHIVENHVLQRMETLDVRPLGANRLEVTTKEYWIIRRYVMGSDEPRTVRSGILNNLYRLARGDSSEWKVVGWEPLFTEDPDPGKPVF